MHKWVVYTAVSKGYDELVSPPALWQPEADFVAFLEPGQPAVEGWCRQPTYRRFRDRSRNAKIHKILAHRFSPRAASSLWLDGSITIISELPLKRWIREYLQEYDMTEFQHRERKCIYHEDKYCIKNECDNPAAIFRQMEECHKWGYPFNNGLVECDVLFRRHTRRIQVFNEVWYAEIKAHSRRDRLSFPYAAMRTGTRYGFFPGNFDRNPHFRLREHPHTLAGKNKPTK